MSRAAVISGALFLLLLAAPEPQAGEPKATSVTNVQVSSAGTVVVTMSGSTGDVNVKLAQVRAPQSFRAGRGCRPQATDYAIARVAEGLKLDEAVRAIPDRKAAADQAYLAAPAEGFKVTASLNARIVRSGLARVTRKRGSHRRKLLAAQRSAKRARRGIWSSCRRR